MGIAVSIETARRLRGTCVRCGGEFPPPALRANGSCAKCSQSTSSLADRRPAAGERPRSLVAGRHLARASQEVLLGLPEKEASTASREAGEIVALDKRFGSLAALVPVIGPLRIRRSDAHTAEEKRKLSALSIALTLLILIGLALWLPHPAARTAALHERIHQETEVLHGLAERYRAEHGAHPTPETWAHLARRADPRFYDPWGRPYRYDVSGEGVLTIGTLGRDAIEGGRGEDADVWRRFPAQEVPTR
jgi:hypothetical protein